MIDKTLYLGIDVGGTKTHVLVCNFHGDVVAEKKYRASPGEHPEPFFKQILTDILDSELQGAYSLEHIKAIGLGLPGRVSSKDYTLSNSPAIKWHGINLKQVLASTLPAKVFFENDVGYAALGELWQGSAQGINNFVMITVGTGIGAAVVINGQLFRGFSGDAGEVGYFTTLGLASEGTRSSSEAFGQLESIASGTGIQMQARSYFEQHGLECSAIQQFVSDPENVTTEHVLAAAGMADEVAWDILATPLRHLSIAISNIISLLNPEVVIVGGGVAESGDVFIEKLRSDVQNTTPISAKIKLASLGNRAGAIGAVRHAIWKSDDVAH